MIDYFCRWNSETEAKQDAARLKNYFGEPLVSDWKKNWFLPNVKAWRISQDVQNPDGSVTHNYLTGWFGILALDDLIGVIMNDNSIAFILDRNGPPYVIKNNLSVTVLKDLGVEPIFAGSHYPAKFPGEILGQGLTISAPILAAPPLI
jgi:hypothetical protein